jgi:hypothetical protein
MMKRLSLFSSARTQLLSSRARGPAALRALAEACAPAAAKPQPPNRSPSAEASKQVSTGRKRIACKRKVTTSGRLQRGSAAAAAAAAAGGGGVAEGKRTARLQQNGRPRLVVAVLQRESARCGYNRMAGRGWWWRCCRGRAHGAATTEWQAKGECPQAAHSTGCPCTAQVPIGGGGRGPLCPVASFPEPMAKKNERKKSKNRTKGNRTDRWSLRGQQSLKIEPRETERTDGRSEDSKV